MPRIRACWSWRFFQHFLHQGFDLRERGLQWLILLMCFAKRQQLATTEIDHRHIDKTGTERQPDSTTAAGVKAQRQRRLAALPGIALPFHHQAGEHQLSALLGDRPPPSVPTAVPVQPASPGRGRRISSSSRRCEPRSSRRSEWAFMVSLFF